NRLFKALVDEINRHYGLSWQTGRYTNPEPAEDIQAQAIIPGKRQRYLSEISESIRDYHRWAENPEKIARRLGQVEGTLEQVDRWEPEGREEFEDQLAEMRDHWLGKLDSRCKKILEGWDELYEEYRQEYVDVQIRDRTFKNKMFRESLSGL